MAVFRIVEFGEPVLKEIARPVKEINANIIKLLENMADTMYAAPGVGLAAPQIGISKRVVVIDVGDGLIELINPVITSAEGEVSDSEGCLSAPKLVGVVPRAEKVVVKALNRRGEECVLEGEGMLARAFQHEIDHLDGILFVDKATSVARKK